MINQIIITVPTLSSDLQMLTLFLITALILSYIYFREIRLTYILTQMGIFISLGLAYTILLPWCLSLMILCFGLALLRLYLKNKTHESYTFM